MLEDKMSGIYKITNLFNGCFYIGSSCNIERRFKTHWTRLRNNKHENSHLQRAINKYGLYNFIFEIVETCNMSEMLRLEQFYIDTLQPEYNICKVAGNTLGYKHTEEALNKMRGENHHMFGKVPSEETRSKLIISKTRENHPLYGKYGSDNPGSKRVIQLTKSGEIINEFGGIKEASRETGIYHGSIIKVCKGKYKSAGGFIWKYKEENLCK